MGNSAIDETERPLSRCQKVLSPFSLGWFIRKVTPLFLIIWFLCLNLGWHYGLQLLQNLNPSVDAPKNSASDLATKAFISLFPHILEDSFPFSTLVVIERKPEPGHKDISVLSKEVERLSAAMVERLKCSERKNNKVVCPPGFEFLAFTRGFEGYYLDSIGIEGKEKKNSLFGEQFVNANEQATLIVIRHNFAPGHVMEDYYDYLEEFFEEIQTGEVMKDEDKKKFRIRYVGESQLLNIAKDAAIYDFEHADMIGIPFAWIILCWYCGLPALLVLITLPTSILFSFAACNHYLPNQLPQFSPSLIVSISVALNVDYALFLLVRYRGELKSRCSKGAAPESVSYANQALDKAMDTAGKTIFVSGSIMLISNGCLSFVKAQTISSLGMGLALTNVVTMAVNLTFLPALLHVFGDQFVNHVDFSLSEKLHKAFGRYVRRNKDVMNNDEEGEQSIFDDGTGFETDSAYSGDLSLDNNRRSQEELELYARFKALQQDTAFVDTRNSLCLSCLTCPMKCICQPIMSIMGKDTRLNSQALTLNSYLDNHFNSQQVSYEPLPDFEEQLVLSDDLFSSSATNNNNANATAVRNEEQMPFSTTHFTANVASDQVKSQINGNSKSIWTKLGHVCRKRPRLIIMVALLLGLPLCFQVLHLKKTDGQMNLLPLNNVHVKTAHDMPNLGLNPGRLADYKGILSSRVPAQTIDKLSKEDCFDDDIFVKHAAALYKGKFPVPIDFISCKSVVTAYEKITGKPGCGLLPPVQGMELALGNICPYSCDSCQPHLATSKAFFNASSRLTQDSLPTLRAFAEPELLNSTLFESPTFVGGRMIEWEEAREYVGSSINSGSKQDLKSLYQSIFYKTVGTNHTAHLLTFYVPFGPFGHRAHPWMNELRHVVKRFELESELIYRQGQKDVKFETFLGGGISMLFDQVDQVYKTTPAIMLTAVVLTVLGTSAFAFGSAMLGPRLLLTIAFTVSLVFGCSVIIFQYLHGSPDSAGLYWIVPIIGLPVIVGCTLDYDSYLVARIFEFRSSGMDTTASVINGLQDTASVITIAGCIMTVAFGSMLFSSVPAIQQVGFVLVTCSLLDTFLVRSVLVPSLMLIAVDANWWPRRMPPATILMDKSGHMRIRNVLIDEYRNELILNR